MDFNRFTEKLQEAVRSAQSIAVQHGNQQLDTEHLLLALLDQQGGLAPSILNKADIRVDALRTRVQQEVDRLPKVSGPSRRSRPGLRHQSRHEAPDAGRRRSQAIERRLRLGRACSSRRDRRRRRHRKTVPRVRHHARAPDAGSARSPRQPARHYAESRGHLRSARKIRPRSDAAGFARQARSGDRARRRNPPRHSSSFAPHQE